MQRIQLAGFCVLLILVLVGCRGEEAPPPVSTTAPDVVRPRSEQTERIANPSQAEPTPTVLLPTATPTPAQQAALPLAGTPTPVPQGEMLTVRPGVGDVGWWSNKEPRGHIGDSFLYAGSADGQVFLSAFRLNLEKAPRGAVIRAASLSLYGLRADRLVRSAPGTWTVQIIDPGEIEDFVQSDFQEIFNAKPAITLLPELSTADLGRGVENRWTLDPASRVRLAFLLTGGYSELIVRVVGPTGGVDNLFAWDSGVGATSEGNGPRLDLILGESPDVPFSLPTATPIVATLTPTPANILTRAAESMTATAVAATTGTYTPTPVNIATPTPLAENIETAQAIAFFHGLPPIVVYTPTPANRATATANAMYATAVALTTGTFTPVPPDAVTPMIITPTPQPENILTSVAQRFTPVPPMQTPLPYNAVVATPTPRPVIVTNTPTPLNAATAIAYGQYATAVAMLTGTFTPTPPWIITATPVPVVRPREAPLIEYLDEVTPTPTLQAPTPPPDQMPAALRGKVLFLSNRDGPEGVFMFDPETGRLARINARWPYELARAANQRSPDGRLSVVVREDNRRVPQINIYDPQYNAYRQITTTTGWSYDPAWSPTGEWIAFVSQETGNDEIFIIRPDGTEMRQLTKNTWEWDKHPSWSPDGREIVFWSNRDTGRPQIWVMNSDGTGQRKLFDSPYEDRDPVWVK